MSWNKPTFQSKKIPRRSKLIDLGNGKTKLIVVHYRKSGKIIKVKFQQDKKPRSEHVSLYKKNMNKGQLPVMPGKDWGRIFEKYNVINKQVRSIIQNSHSYTIPLLFLCKLIYKYTQSPDIMLQIIQARNTMYMHTYFLIPKSGRKKTHHFLDFWAKKSLHSLIEHMKYRWLADNIAMALQTNLFTEYTRFPHEPDKLHEFLSKEIRKKESDNITIEYNEQEQKFFNHIHKVDDHILIPAHQTHDLINWGAKLCHCIGSYQNTAKSKNGYFLAVYNKHNELEYNIWIDKTGSINQFQGFQNCSPPSQLYQKVQKKVIDGWVVAKSQTA